MVIEGVREVVDTVEDEETVTAGYDKAADPLGLGMGTKGRAATLRFGSDGVNEEDTTEEVNVGAEERGKHAARNLLDDNAPVGGDMLKEDESEEALGKGFGMGDPRAIDLD